VKCRAIAWAALSTAGASGSALDRQIEHPLAVIIHDVEGEFALRAVLRLVVDDEAQLADLSG
jgi:hypothetical protein